MQSKGVHGSNWTKFMLNSYPPLSNWVEKNSTHHRPIRSSGLDESSFSQVASNQLTPTNNKERHTKKCSKRRKSSGGLGSLDGDLVDIGRSLPNLDSFINWIGWVGFWRKKPTIIKIWSEDPSLISQSPDRLIFDSFPIGALGWVKFGGSMDNFNANKQVGNVIPKVQPSTWCHISKKLISLSHGHWKIFPLD